jgi:hypothetical protein
VDFKTEYFVSTGIEYKRITKKTLTGGGVGGLRKRAGGAKEARRKFTFKIIKISV